MKTVTSVLAAAAVCASANAATVNVDPSTGSWLAFMNVSELPANGGGFVFGSPWGVPDLTADFDDVAQTLTLGPNTINDPNEFWYQNTTGNAADPQNPGGPGQAGNKIMEANLFQESTGGALNGTTVTFEGVVLSNSFTPAHEASIFIRDFASDFSSFNDTTIPLTPGAFSISLNTIPDPSRFVQWGFQVKGVNVWSTDVAPFGNAVIATIPTPGAFAMIGAAGLVATRRRRG